MTVDGFSNDKVKLFATQVITVEQFIACEMDLSSPRAERARAVTVSQCPHSFSVIWTRTGPTLVQGHFFGKPDDWTKFH